VPFVAVATGAWSAAELSAAGATRVVASFSELDALLGA